MTTKHPTRLPLTIATVLLLALAGAAGAQAAAPTKLVIASHFGREVNLTETNLKAGPALEDVCTVASKDTCQLGSPSPEPGGFEYPYGVAAASNGNIYVADAANRRVQELTSSGAFVLMFGEEVNETTHGNICTEEEITVSKVKCKRGIEGGTAEAVGFPNSIAVDPSTGNVYVQDKANNRVDEYTASGRFVLMIGKEVNETKADAVKAKGDTPNTKELEEENLCTAASKDLCKAGVRPLPEGNEKSTFFFGQFLGGLITVGGPEHLLYVGDQHRVQEFKPDGTWVGEIFLESLAALPESRVTTLTVDEAGDVYLVYDEVSFGVNNAEIELQQSVVHEFNPKGEEVKHFEVPPREAGKEVQIAGIAMDPDGRLAVVAIEGDLQFGIMYEPNEARQLIGFAIPGMNTSNQSRASQYINNIGFGPGGELYAGLEVAHEVVRYVPVAVAELVTGAATCKPGAETETDASFDCALNGEANPEGISETEVSFQWGATLALGAETPAQSVPTVSALTPVPPASLDGLPPNETFYYQLAGHDENVKAPERLSGVRASFSTPVVAPKIVGGPTVAFIGFSSALMFGELNPEHANTTYELQYAPCENLEDCSTTAQTAPLQSALYGKVYGTFEARELQPGTTYHYRLLASDEHVLEGKTVGGSAAGPEGTFTTMPAPAPRTATSPPLAVAATTATVAGTVDPDGQPATYAIELGVYAGAATRYGIVFSGNAGASVAPVAESLGLTGLQPGTTYAYRIEISSGYGTAYGEPVLFTTVGLPAVLVAPVSLPQLAIPAIAFPPEVRATVTGPVERSVKRCAKGMKLGHGKCVKSKHKQAKRAKK